jgi:CheY-like chemotaxis protein
MASKKLLVADDSLTIQKVIRLALSGAAAGSGDTYDIQAVSDGNDAIQQISLFRPEVVLIDVSLPGKSAFEVKRAINEHRDLDEVRFVLMSSAFEKVDEKQLAEVEFHGRLTKPFDPAHLREVLSKVLSQIHEKHREPTVLIHRDAINPPPPPPTPSFEYSLETADEMPPSLPTGSGLGFDSPPPVPPSDGDNDNDIRELTESTIRMAGLDDFQWTVQEPSLKTELPLEAPAVELEPQIGSGSENELELSPPPIELEPETEHEFDTAIPMVEIEPPVIEKTGEYFNERKFDHPWEPELRPELPSQNNRPMAAPQTETTHPSGVSQELIRQEVENAIQAMAQKLLPEIAERLIKAEIRKLLNEAP